MLDNSEQHWYPLGLDTATKGRTKPSLAKVRVEVNLLKKLPEKVWVGNGRRKNLLKGYYQKVGRSSGDGGNGDMSGCNANINENNEEPVWEEGQERPEKHEDFLEVVSDCWNKPIKGNAMRLQSKLKALSTTFSRWSSTIGDIIEHVKERELLRR
ncbi:hypothetical protein HAX54_041626 [Datura stramonium]|uniref:Uncharacterized protein n=1 Tax=Datura stramonium TaxID=4076 RepID=A0ABS8VXC1_DATST|nr:hypothetical protein [Datura stramonium]